MSKFILSAAALSLLPAMAFADEAAEDNTIVVTASAPDLAQRPNGQTVTGVTSDDFANQPASTIAEVLVMQPGVTIQHGNGPRDISVSVRGSNVRQTFGVRNVQVFEDGFPVTQPDGLARTDLTDPHAYAGIDVAHGPSSALYGNYALGGAILFRTRSGRDIDGFELGVDAGDFGYRNIFATLGGGSDIYDAAVFASYVSGDGFTTHTGYETATVNALASFSPTPDDTFTFKFINNDLDTDLSIRLSMDQFSVNPYQDGCEVVGPTGCASISVLTNGFNGARQSVSATQAALRRDDRRTIVGVRWEHDFDANTSGRVQGVWDNRDIEQPTGNAAAIGTFPSYSVMADVTRETNLFGAEARLQAGVWGNYLDNNSYTYNVMPNGDYGGLTRSILGSASNYGARFRAELESNARWLFVLGLGVERTELDAVQASITYPTTGAPTVVEIGAERTFTNVAPELSVVYRPTETVRLYARAAAGYGTPQIGNLFVTPDGVAGANTELDAQRNIGIDIGIDAVFGDTFSISAAVYQEWFRDELVTQSAGANLLAYTFNAPKSEHRGIELAADWRPLPEALHGFTARVSYLHNEQTYEEYVERLSAGAFSTTFDRSGNDIPGVVPNYVNARLSYEQEEGAFAGLGGFIELSSRDAYYLDNANLLEAPDYQLFNVSLHYDPQSGPLANARFYLSAQNITDEVFIGSASNIANTISATTGLQNGAASLRATTGSIYAGAPRAIVGGVRVRF
ncbi:MAG: TonB-dependent receptor family protein [Hyphomonadaceae bacterium]